MGQTQAIIGEQNQNAEESKNYWKSEKGMCARDPSWSPIGTEIMGEPEIGARRHGDSQLLVSSTMTSRIISRTSEISEIISPYIENERKVELKQHQR